MKKIAEWWQERKKAWGLLKSLFNDSAQLQEEVNKRNEELKEIKEKKDRWNAKCLTTPWNEDDVYNIKSVIRDDRKQLFLLRNELRIVKGADKIKEIEDKIKIMECQTENDEKKLAGLNLRYKEYLESSGIKTAEVEAEKEKAEKQLEGKKKMQKYWSYLIYAVLSISAVITTAVSLIFLFIFGIKIWLASCILILPVALILAATIIAKILLKGYTEVPEKEEWIIQFQGKYLTNWEAGWYIKFPFFMEIRGKVFMGDNMLKLHMAEKKDQAGKPSAKVDFIDSSAEVIVNIFYRVFNSRKAIYDIDDAEKAIAEKMEAGIRAYYGNQTIDEAIASRAEVELRKIIIQSATEAEVFKSWGIKIISLAVTDIILPKDVEELRTNKLKAEKEREVAEIKKEQTRIEVETAELQGQGAGNRLKGMATATGKTVEEIISLHLQEKKFEAWSKSGMLIVNNDSSETANNAIKGAAMGSGMKISKPAQP
ncbi:MAG: SPFH domain-containing protein [Patescibacteria group bacterium]|jgi:regulator of protease activity HflC (stomatin/prohibitin superfamily)